MKTITVTEVSLLCVLYKCIFPQEATPSRKKHPLTIEAIFLYVRIDMLLTWSNFNDDCTLMVPWSLLATIFHSILCVWCEYRFIFVIHLGVFSTWNIACLNKQEMCLIHQTEFDLVASPETRIPSQWWSALTCEGSCVLTRIYLFFSHFMILTIVA